MTAVETWLDIPGYEGRYRVSDQGQVLALARERLIRGRLQPRKECLLQGTIKKWGHRRVQLYFNGKRREFFVHRLVMLAFVGPVPEGMEVCHNNGDPTDNRLTNLRYGTRSDNERDKVRHGTHNFAHRTHCPQGHEYTPENTGNDRGRRRCLACNRDRCRARYSAAKVSAT